MTPVRRLAASVLMAFMLVPTVWLAACTVQIDQTSTIQNNVATIPPAIDVTPSPTLPPQIDTSGFALSGRLLINHLSNGLLLIDLTTGEISSLFTPEPGSLLAAASPSPDGTQLVIAYSPPPDGGEVQFGYTSLYVMSLDGGALPEPYLVGSDEDGYFTPTWSPDGRIYYAHFRRSEMSQDSSGFELERISYPEETGESLLTDALWPDFSPDGEQMTFIRFNRETLIDELYIANADGSGLTALLEEGLFQAVDSPRFSPDGTQVLFSAVPFPEEPETSWWDQTFGTKVARAHAVPSDLWIVPAEGGQPQQLTDLFVVGLSGDFSPDGAYIAFVSVEGLFVMKADGSELTQLLANPGLGGLQWIP